VCDCKFQECPVYKKCCFLPTEYFLFEDKLKILFIGQGGGATERIQKRPFCGRAGEYLRELIIYCMKQNKKTVGIAFSNTIRDNPDGNRVPSETELTWCMRHLITDIVKLKEFGLSVIIPLGNAATSVFLKGQMQPITKSRGKCYQYVVDSHTFTVIPTYHPSYLLRQAQNVKHFNPTTMTQFDENVISDVSMAIRIGE